MTAANRTRGANAERAVVNWLRTHGYPDARRYLAGPPKLYKAEYQAPTNAPAADVDSLI